MPLVETLSNYAFNTCQALTSVYIPASCTSIGFNPFVRCTGLKEIVVEESNPNYSSADAALYDKGKTTLIGWPTAEGDIDIMPSVTTIGVGAFDGCSALTSVDIPASVTMIGDYAFDGCSSLTSVYCHWDEPLECEPEFEDEIFMNATLYVPTGTVDAYRSVSPWDKFINIEEKDYSGIADTPQPEVTVKVIDGAIAIEGGDGMASAPVVEVYSAGGVCVWRGTESSIGGLPHGVYVVRVGSTVQKVAL